MAGYVLPVLLSWHVGARMNEAAGDASVALDPEEFWRAWAARAAARVDTFAPEWDFWAHAEKPLAALRSSERVPRADLPPQLQVPRGGPGNLDRLDEWSFCLTAARMAAG
jgi:hypothetical protein